MIERGTLPGQRTVVATLETIAERAGEEGIRPPSITLVGDVAALREEGVRWFETRPLFGRTVAVTRAREQTSGLAARVRALGAEVVETPVIKIVPLDPPAPDPSHYDLVCLTSPNGVRLLFERLATAGLDARALHRARVAAIGPATARALRAHGVLADVMPERAVAESLVEALGDAPVQRALVARARVARDVLPDALHARGTRGRRARAVRNGRRAADRRAARRGAHRRLRHVHVSFDRRQPRERRRRQTRLPPPASPRSARSRSDALRTHGLAPHLEADQHDIDGLLAALVADAAAR